MKSMITKIVLALFRCLPLPKPILFESVPVYADNTRAVCEEMIARGLHKKYAFYWTCPENAQIPQGIPYVRFIRNGGGGIWDRIKRAYVYNTAKAIISCNAVIPRYREGQYTICLMHGAPLKNVKGHYTLPKELDDVLSFSHYLAPIEADVVDIDVSKMVVLGFPRNDILFRTKLDPHRLFPNAAFEKLIYWMPTYRQHQNGSVDVSNIAMPIIYNEQIAMQVNDAAKQAGVLVVVKPHFAQDVSRITMMHLSNLVFINDQFLADSGVTNYELLGKADALLTDYSSVYYDYLLLDRPIGLCWDDYDVFEEREGFAVDMAKVMAGGEKIYTADDLCGFIAHLAAGEDRLAVPRKEVIALIHEHKDDRASQRTVDLIEKRLGR